jgi:hypothetical protein
MRRFVLLVLLALTTFPAAAKRLTVAQLEQELSAARAGHKADAEIAHQINAIELSERLTEAVRDRLTSDLASDPKAQLALRLLADLSAFLGPPTSELPQIEAPDEASQQRMLEAMRDYVGQTLLRLPNFLATRTTERYDDSPQAIKQGAWPVRVGLHLIDSSSREISIRDEQESHSPIMGSALGQAQTGMISGGEFGTTLGMILADIVNGKVTWSRWEQSPSGLSAVFHYSVPKSASHYQVIGLQKQPPSIAATPQRTGGSRGTLGIGTTNNGTQPPDTLMVRTRPSYHGSLWVNPTTGAVLRVSVQTDAKDGGPLRRADILVQYGPVEIGGAVFICPVRSLALSAAFVSTEDITGDAPTQWLNETQFTGYHRFGSTVRILKDTANP